jgi:hypothetical protein
MRNILVTMMLAAAVISLGSCKKDYICDCNVTITIPSYSESRLERTEMQNTKKKDAEAECKDREETRSFLGQTGTAKYDCELKEN